MAAPAADEHVAPRARTRTITAIAAGIQGDYERTSALLTTSLALSRQLGDQHGIASALNKLGVTPRDLIAVLQAMHGAGYIAAEIEVE